MKLSKEVLLEIVDIVRDGLTNNNDISERLRELDLVASSREDGHGHLVMDELTLSDEYVEKHPRGGSWN